MSGRESFTDPPRITNTDSQAEDFVADLHEAMQKTSLPVIVYCRTYSLYGFSKDSYESSIDTELYSSHRGKKRVFLDFLKDYNYTMIDSEDFYNNYYLIFTPDGDGMKYDDYMRFIVPI
jgi:hypothetical protein